jgi:hypothetical protein
MIEFINDLNRLHKTHIYKISSNAKVPQLTAEEEQKYRCARVCENCKKEFGTKREDGTKVDKVRHHDHLTNKYVGAWCS